MRCASSTTYWVFAGSNGNTRIRIDGLSLEPEGATCVGSQYVVLNHTEFDLYTSSPFRLSTSDGVAISVAIIGLWASAWAMRAFVMALKSGNPET